MGAANGFVTTQPDARYGDAQGTAGIIAAKFTVPGSGDQLVSIVGAWLYAADSGKTARFAIFTHDAGNDKPETMVTNSETTDLSLTSGSVVHVSHTYSPQPTVTGGSTYWIARIDNATSGAVSRFATAVSGVYFLSPTYPTWPSDDGWHAATANAKDYSFYAVYAAAGGAAIPVLLNLQRRFRD